MRAGPFVSLLPLLFGLAATGCEGRLKALQVHPLTVPPVGGSATDAGIFIAEGTAMAVRIVAYTSLPGDSGETCTTVEDDDGLRVTTCQGNDPSSVSPASIRAEVEGFAATIERVDDGVFVILGLAQGLSRLTVSSTEALGQLAVPMQVDPQ